MASSCSPLSIVASDLDGTLLSPNHRLSEFSKLTLNNLHKNGFTFVFATGRHHVDVAGIREMVGIPAYMVTSNGARVYDPENKLLYSRNIPEDLVQQVINLLKGDKNLYIHAYHNDDWLLNKVDQELRNYHDQSGFTYKPFSEDHAPKNGVAKLFFTHMAKDHDVLAEYEAQLHATFGDQITISFSTPWCLEVMGPNVSKGHALKTVAESLGKKLENTIAFGDGMNDVEMLSMAHKGLLMGTAHEKVLKALPHIERIGSCADEAVAHYLTDHLLKSVSSPVV